MLPLTMHPAVTFPLALYGMAGVQQLACAGLSECLPYMPYGMCAQVIGMSATIPNVDVVSRWLDAALYLSTFRPVQLSQYLKV